MITVHAKVIKPSTISNLQLVLFIYSLMASSGSNIEVDGGQES